MRIGAFGFSELLIVLVVFVLLWLVPVLLFWRIFTKAGYEGALALLLLVPGVGYLAVACILAFGEWPARQPGGLDAQR